MSARIIPLFAHVEPAVRLDQTLDQALRLALQLGDMPWSDSVLIAALATATPFERGVIIRELEARAMKGCQPAGARPSPPARGPGDEP